MSDPTVAEVLGVKDWPRLQLVGVRPDGERFYVEQQINPSLLTDRLALRSLLGMMAHKLAEVAGGPCEPTMLLSPWERWEIEDGEVVAVESAVEYGPAPWDHKP